MRRWMALAVITGALVGCYDWRRGVREAAQVHHQCATGNITVVSDNGDGYARIVELRVCGARRVYQDLGGRHGYAWVDVTGSTGGEESPRGSSEPPAPDSRAGAVRSAASVERHEARTAAGTYAVYEATVPAGELTLVLTAAPARETDRLWLSVGGSPSSVPESCALGVLTDGQLTRLEGERILRDGRAMYRVPVDFALLRRMAAATRVAGRVCDREWRVGPESEAALDELVARIDEERTWLSSTGDAPRSGDVPFVAPPASP